MLARSPMYRLRTSVLFLSLLLGIGLSALPPTARADVVAATASQQQSGPAAQAATGRALQAMQEAYELLLDRYALPLDPAVLADSAQQGMTDALKEAGVDNPAAGLGTLGSDRGQQFAAVRQRFQALATRYGDVLPSNELGYAAIKAMADSVDDSHTNFMNPDQYQEYVRWSRGEEERYAGIGTRMRGPLPTIVEVFRGTPAERAGLAPGDAIVSIDGRPTADLKLDEVVNLVRGPEGTPVTLGIQRAISGQVDDVTIVRAQVAIPFVSSRRLPGDLGYVQLRSFPEPSVVEAVEQAITELQRDGVRGIVMDLRGNGGGRVDVGSRLLQRFVPDGPIYQAVDRRGRQETINVRGSRPILTVPLAVLVDEGTASMGEIFAAAVQEQHAGRVIGATTAGSVAASVVMPLSDGSALQLSIELVYSGGGTLLDRVGVHPDDEVELDLIELRLGRDVQLERAASYLQEQAARQPAPVQTAGR